VVPSLKTWLGVLEEHMKNLNVPIKHRSRLQQLVSASAKSYSEQPIRKRIQSFSDEELAVIRARFSWGVFFSFFVCFLTCEASA
jgi:hypothetical protein